MTNVATIAICLVGVTGCLAFLGYWATKAGMDIFRREVSIYLALGMADLLTILGLIASTRIFGDWPGRREVVLVLVFCYTLQPWWLLRLTVHAYRKPVEERKQP